MGPRACIKQRGDIFFDILSNLYITVIIVIENAISSVSLKNELYFAYIMHHAAQY